MPKKGRKTCKHILYYEFSRSTLYSSDSEFSSLTTSVGLATPMRSRNHLPYLEAKSDYLSRLFEKKKLKEKSISKKLRTPFDRKLTRSCWPIELSKISKIKKKPKEKKKGKPNYKSLKERKFLNSNFMTRLRNIGKKTSVSISDSNSENDEPTGTRDKSFHPNHFFYEPVTPQMLMDVLQDPEHLKSGATLEMIITKLRALKLDLNPTIEMLKKEVLQKLRCAITLGMVVETEGYYTVVHRFRVGKLPRKKVDAFWDLWHKKPAKFA